MGLVTHGRSAAEAHRDGAHRNGASRDGARAALARSLPVLVAHLHAAVREVRPSRDELDAALAFLTEVGQASDERRQEWVLLADLLGVSALVAELDAHDAGATPAAPRGPFHRDDAPLREAGTDLCLDGRGEPLDVRLRVVDLDGAPVAGAELETWQPNADGAFENQRPDEQPEFNLRGRFVTDVDGRTRYRSVRPGGYRVPADGPAGRLLGGLGHSLERPAHLHFRVRAAGFETLVTQVYDRDDPRVDRDALHAVRPALLGAFVRGPDDPDAAPHWSLDFTFVLARTSPSPA